MEQRRRESERRGGGDGDGALLCSARGRVERRAAVYYF